MEWKLFKILVYGQFDELKDNLRFFNTFFRPIKGHENNLRLLPLPIKGQK